GQPATLWRCEHVAETAEVAALRAVPVDHALAPRGSWNRPSTAGFVRVDDAELGDCDGSRCEGVHARRTLTGVFKGFDHTDDTTAGQLGVESTWRSSVVPLLPKLAPSTRTSGGAALLL